MGFFKGKVERPGSIGRSFYNDQTLEEYNPTELSDYLPDLSRTPEQKLQDLGVNYELNRLESDEEESSRLESVYNRYVESASKNGIILPQLSRRDLYLITRRPEMLTNSELDMHIDEFTGLPTVPSITDTFQPTAIKGRSGRATPVDTIPQADRERLLAARQMLNAYAQDGDKSSIPSLDDMQKEAAEETNREVARLEKEAGNTSLASQFVGGFGASMRNPTTLATMIAAAPLSAQSLIGRFLVEGGANMLGQTIIEGSVYDYRKRRGMSDEEIRSKSASNIGMAGLFGGAFAGFLHIGGKLFGGGKAAHAPAREPGASPTALERAAADAGHGAVPGSGEAANVPGSASLRDGGSIVDRPEFHELTNQVRSHIEATDTYTTRTKLHDEAVVSLDGGKPLSDADLQKVLTPEAFQTFKATLDAAQAPVEPARLSPAQAEQLDVFGNQNEAIKDFTTPQPKALTDVELATLQRNAINVSRDELKQPEFNFDGFRSDTERLLNDIATSGKPEDRKIIAEIAGALGGNNLTRQQITDIKTLNHVSDLMANNPEAASMDGLNAFIAKSDWLYDAVTKGTPLDGRFYNNQTTRPDLKLTPEQEQWLNDVKENLLPQTNDVVTQARKLNESTPEAVAAYDDAMEFAYSNTKQDIESKLNDANLTEADRVIWQELKAELDEIDELESALEAFKGCRI